MIEGQPTSPQIQDQLAGTLERIVFQNEDNGYTVARLHASGKNPEVTIVGNLMGINVGERLNLIGKWTAHPQYGKQFEVATFTVQYPATLEGIRKYLGSGLIRGIGPATATRIVDRFGKDTLEVIDQSPERLIEIPGIAQKKVARIAEAWQEQRQVKEIMVFLQSNGVSTGLAVRIYRVYGQESVHVVQTNPYRLAQDVNGIGFKTADKIARQVGIAADHPARIQAGLVYTLNQMSNDGHCFSPEGPLVKQASEILEMPEALCMAQLEPMTQQAMIVKDSDRYYLPPFYAAESGVARRLMRMVNAERDRLAVFRRMDWVALEAILDRQTSIRLTDQQKIAVKMALTEKVSILTGGPGTGKSTITASIIHLLQTRNGSVLLCAPTGRAAKKLSEATGLEAKTIHRLLEYKPSS
ncbi:MAG: AAA family ATPase [Anaerolineae bacterium]|nr:AAA family ATPase [Anaerolineae bacterium]